MTHTMILDHPIQQCDECSTMACIALYEQSPISRLTTKAGCVCWEHYTPELMALPELYEYAGQ